MTTINFKRSGGILGREIDTDIDLDKIPEAESQELLRLINETNFFNIPQNLIAQTTHDEFEYTITMEAGNTHHTIHTSDSTAPESLRPLLEKLSTLTRGGNSSTSQG